MRVKGLPLNTHDRMIGEPKTYTKVTHTIRQYKESDLDGVLSAWENASKIAHSFLTREFIDKERNNIPNMYLPIADTWVVEVEGTTIGFISLLGNEVGAIFVEPAFHGLGLGRAMMDKAREIHGNLEVEVFKENSIGRTFYSGYGFTLMHEKTHEETGNRILRLRYSTNENAR